MVLLNHLLALNRERRENSFRKAKQQRISPTARHSFQSETHSPDRKPGVGGQLAETPVTAAHSFSVLSGLGVE